MFLRKLDKDVPDWRDEVAKGRFSPVGGWLAENVHSRGNLYDPADLIKVVTGESLSIKPFLDYLKTKVDSVYG